MGGGERNDNGIRSKTGTIYLETLMHVCRLGHGQGKNSLPRVLRLIIIICNLLNINLKTFWG